jgi:outer membrane protein
MLSILLYVILLSALTESYAQDSSPGSNTIRHISLEEALRIALEKSPYAARAVSERAQAKTLVLQTAGTVVPHLTVTSGYNRSGPEQEVFIPDIPGFPVDPAISPPVLSTSEYTTSINVSQSLVNVPAWFGIRGAINSSSAASFAYTASLADLAYNTKQAYYNQIQLYKNMHIADIAITQSEEQVAIAQERFRLGSISRPELLRIQVNLSQRRVDLITVETEFRAGRRNLANLLGISGPIMIDTALTFPDTTAPIQHEDSLVRRALAVNPSLQAARATDKAAFNQLQAIRLSKIPGLAASFSYGVFDNALFDQFTDWSRNDFWNIAVQLNWSIFEGGVWLGRLREASARRASNDAELTITRNETVESMYQAHGDLRAACSALSLVVVLLEQADEEYRLNRERYRLGAASPDELLTAQLSYTEALGQYTQAIIGYHLSRARIQQLLGDW